MPDRIKRVFAGFSTALGAVAAIFGVRALLRWSERRALEEERQQRVRNRIAQPQAPTSRHQPQDQPDRQPVPATGASATAEPDLARAANQTSTTVELEAMVSPLSQYLLAFHQMIELLRKRRAAGGAPAGTRTLSEDDRAGFQETLERLETLIPDYGPGNLENDSLQARIYRLMAKVRDALHNRDFSDDDLFRINGEVSAETCRMLAEIQWAGADSGPDFEQVRQAYDCG